MPEDSNTAATVEEDELDNAQDGSSTEDDSTEELSFEEIEANIKSGTAVSDKDLTRYLDHKRGIAVAANIKKTQKEASRKAAEDKKNQEQEDKKKAVDKMPEGEEKISAGLEIRQRELDEKEHELEQRGYLAIVKEAPGCSDLPDGVYFDSNEAAESFVEFMKSYKPAVKADGQRPGMPPGNTSTKPLNLEDKRKSLSNSKVARLFKRKDKN